MPALLLLAIGGLTPPRVAVVTGASRGIGRGIALELGRAGYTVYALGRSSRSSGAADGDLTVEATADAVRENGGVGVPYPCEITRAGSLDAAIEAVRRDAGRLDVLVCSAYTTPPGALRDDFWKQGVEMWDACNEVGLRAVYATCVAAAPLMIETARADSARGKAAPPLIALVSSFGGQAYTFNVAYGVGKAAVDRLARDMSVQLTKVGVATTSLYPGIVKTERNLQLEAEGRWAEASGGLDLAQGETPAFSGKALLALRSLDAEAMMARSGNVEVVAELAREFDFTEEDGSRPASIRSLKYLLPNFVFPQIEAESGKPLPEWMRANVPDFLLPWSIFASGPPPEKPAATK